MSGGWWVSVGSLGSSVGEAGGLGGQVVLEVLWVSVVLGGMNDKKPEPA